MDTIEVELSQYVPSIDWVTATKRNLSDASDMAHFTRSAWGYLRANYPNTEAERWSFMGFYGWKLGGLCWGGNGERSIIRAYGEAANFAWVDAVRYGDRVSRLDLAVTFFPTDRGDDLAELCADVAIGNRAKGATDKRRHYALISGFGQGDTLYIGSRSSQTFARLYDKSAQSRGEYARGAWRAEVELKDERALATGRQLLASSDPSKAIAGFVSGVFSQSGINLNFARDWQMALPVVGREKDQRIDRMLDWLSTGVKPVALKCARAVGRETVIAVLGLDGTKLPLEEQEYRRIIREDTGSTPKQ